MPRANQPLPNRQLSLFPPSCPGPDRTSLPMHALDTAARLMAWMLLTATADNEVDGRMGRQTRGQTRHPARRRGKHPRMAPS
jgi:hypothetical protein